MNRDIQLFKQQIRARLAAHQRLTVTDPTLTCAAVLLLVLFKDSEWHIVVTQRTQTVVHHRGQISFPGGACEPDDADRLHTAVRETHEEIGVPSWKIEVLGALDDFRTISGFIVTPFVGILSQPVSYTLNTHEVEAVLEVPLSFLQEPTNLRHEQREHDGQLFDVLSWDYGEYTIWGATAGMLKSFLDLIA